MGGGAQVDVAAQRLVEQRRVGDGVRRRSSPPGICRRRTAPGCRSRGCGSGRGTRSGAWLTAIFLQVGVAWRRGRRRWLAARVGAALDAAAQADAELRLEAEREAVEQLEVLGRGPRVESSAAAGEAWRPSRSGSRSVRDACAAGRVVGEFVAVHVDADVAQVERDAVDDVGDRVRGAASRSAAARCADRPAKAERITIVPRSKGPTVAELIATSESGAPW